MKKYAAEFIATFFVVFAGAGAVIAEGYLSGVRLTASFGVIGIAFAYGLALALAIAATRHISGGHANPAITIAFWITRRIAARDALSYIAAQLAGGVAAAFLLRGIMPGEAVSFAGAGVTALGDGVGFRQGLSIEVVLTFFLAFVIWGVAVDRRGPAMLAPLAIGLVFTLDTIAGGPFTGAAMNPARWFGPALAAGEWDNLLVWILGPILGALLGALLYETFFLGEQPPPEEGVIQEELPLDEEEEEEEERVPEPVAARPTREPWREPDRRPSPEPERMPERAPSPEPERAPERGPEAPPPPDSVITPPREMPPAPPPVQPERPAWERPSSERPSWERPSEEKTEE